MSVKEEGRMPCARALFGFSGENEHELSFGVGVSILLLRRIDDNWLEGHLNGKIGIFPANHVTIELGNPSLARESALASSGRPYAIALQQFIGECPGDLSFEKGDLVELVGSAGSGWLRGSIKDQVGIFPASFVEIVKPLENGGSTEIKTKAESSESSESSDGMNIVTDGPIPKPRPRTRKTLNGIANKSEILPTVSNGGQGPSKDSLLPPPSRSAPAPPLSSPTLEEDSDNVRRLPYTLSLTLPKPKPRKKMTRHTSISSAELQVNSLETDLVIEQKMLESAQNLLKVCQSETKRDKLSEAVRNHYATVRRLKRMIKETKAARETLVSQQTLSPPPPSPPPPPHNAPIPTTLEVSPKPLEQQRSKVIEELLFTERDYHHQMQLCCSKVIPALSEVPDFSTDIVFGNIKEVAALSGEFLAELQKACKEEKTVGKVFVMFAVQLRDVYAVYCRNHDTAVATLEKCMENASVSDKIRGSLDLIRGETQAWDLQSLIIKPVQRVLKYPLLLDKLVESTTDMEQPDYKAVRSARQLVGEVVQDINEIKRRKDLVVRYTGPTHDKRGAVSMHSIQKKARRIKQAITQFTGLRSKTVDPQFDEEEQRVLSLESMLNNLIRDVQSWQDEIQRFADNHETLGDGMALYCSDIQSLSDHQRLVKDLQQTVKAHAHFVSEHVLTSLQNLLSLFQDPLHLIHKRRDKLLDYDHMQYALEHAEEAEKIKQLREDCLLAKRNYEALNTQLLEELPHFVQLVVKALQHILTVLVQAHYTFHSSLSDFLESLSGRIEGSMQFQQEHAQGVQVVAQQLIQLSMVPASLAISFSAALNAQGTTTPRKISDSSPIMRLRQYFREDEPEDIEELPEGTELVVLYDFAAQDRAEMSVSAGQVVTLLCPHDRIGCKEWWLVQAGEDKGYVPATYLSEHKPSISTDTEDR